MRNNTNDVAGSTFVDGVTNFSTEALLDTYLDSDGAADGDFVELRAHPVVFRKMCVMNLVDYLDEATPTFMGIDVVEDAELPSGAALVRGDGSPGDPGTFETRVVDDSGGHSRLITREDVSRLTRNF